MLKKTRSTTTKRRKTEESAEDLGIYPAADFETGDTALIYGRSGTGKTTLFATWPTPALLLNISDDGIGSVKKIKGLDVVDVKDLDHLDRLYNKLRDGEHKYRTVGIDTITKLQDMIVQSKISDDGRNRRVDFGTLSRKDWGDVAGTLKEKLTDFRDLSKAKGMNVIFLAQDRVFNGGEEDEGTEDLHIGPAVSPSVKSAVCAMVNLVANTFIREKKTKKEVNGKRTIIKRMQYCLGIGPSALYIRKFRKDKDVVLPDYIVDPSYDAINETLEG